MVSKNLPTVVQEGAKFVLTIYVSVFAVIYYIKLVFIYIPMEFIMYSIGVRKTYSHLTSTDSLYGVKES